MHVDLPLVRRIEASAAHQSVLLAEAMARTSPPSGAAAEWFDGGAFVACGPGRYVNRGVGLGLGSVGAAETLAALEEFSSSHAVPAMLEVSPWVAAELVEQLSHRAYTVAWFRNVYTLAVTPSPPLSDNGPRGAHSTTSYTFAEVDDDTVAAWAGILGGHTKMASSERGRSDEFCAAGHAVVGEHDLLALRIGGGTDADPVACGSWNVIDRVGWLGGAATLERHRGRGAQRALIAERVRRAIGAGADLCAATALPDGPSARNLLASGFELLYTQAVMLQR